MTSHSVVLTNLENHATYYYQVRSTSADGLETISSENINEPITFPFPLHSFEISIPPDSPILIDKLDQSCSLPCAVTLEWNVADYPYDEPLDYRVRVDNNAGMGSAEYISGWLSETEAFCDGSTCRWTVTILTVDTWYWQVRARDAEHTTITSDWSIIDSFILTEP